MSFRDSEEVILPVIALLLLATVLPLAFPVISNSSTLVSGLTGQSDGVRRFPALSGYPQSAGESLDTRPPRTLCRNDSELGVTTATRAEAHTRASQRNVSIAIIDPTGFAVDEQRYASNIAASKSFTRARDIQSQRRNRHGTATAALVTRFAPNASLYLANFDTAHGFTRAITWAIEQDVDVIIAPVSFYAKPNDGSSMVSSAVTKAVTEGIPVVTPTGNVAQKHWEGVYEGDTNRWVTFEAGDTRMYLHGNHSRVRVWLWWNRSNASKRHNFDVVLYHDRSGEIHRVGESEEYPRGPVGTNQVLFERVRTNNLLATSAPSGSYFIRIRGPPNATHRVEVVTVYHRLENPATVGSIVAPATAKGEGVIAVGAYSLTSGKPLSSSGRGPTADGRRGVDFLAPGIVAKSAGNFTGTSAATAYAGGVVALMKVHDPTLTPEQIERVLEETTYSTPSIPHNTSGSGILNAQAAIQCVATDGKYSLGNRSG